VRIAFTSYPTGGEVTTWFDMPQVPAAGDTVHFHGMAWQVMHVSWAPDTEGRRGDHPVGRVLACGGVGAMTDSETVTRITELIEAHHQPKGFTNERLRP
jgi:hypothetical protein